MEVRRNAIGPAASGLALPLTVGRLTCLLGRFATAWIDLWWLVPGWRRGEMASLATDGKGAGANVAACGGCRRADLCAAASPGTRGPFRGASLVVASLAYFLAPAGLALLGAVLAGGDAVRQLLGGAVGLLLGMTGAALGARRHAAARAGEDCLDPR